MVAFDYDCFPPKEARFLRRNQKNMNAGQRDMAQSASFLIWVNDPKRTGLPKATRLAVWAAHPHQCRYCEIPLTPLTFTVDHIVARARGGGDEMENLCLACRNCNCRKSTKDAAEFY